MQAVSALFTAKTSASVRRLSVAALISFSKTKSAATRYFTVGVSAVGGPDPIGPPTSTTAITEWDKYPYIDFSDRVLNMEATLQQDLLGSLTLGMADLELHNTDDKFTPGVDGVIGSVVQTPRRPLRLAAGFDTQTVPIFVGLTEKSPTLSADKKTAKFHAIDFIKSIAEIPLTETVMYQNKRIDEVISSLLITQAALSAAQFTLDPGMRVVPFIWFKKDMKLGEAIRQLCEGELARFFQDETGHLRLWNRQHTNKAPYTTSQWTFNRNNCREIEYPESANVINSVEISGNIRAVQANQRLWELSSATKVLPGQTLEIFADFKDDYGELPVTTIDTPVYVTVADTSYYATNEAQDGSGLPMDAYISITSFSKFATGCKIVFTNSHPTNEVYITQLEFFARPAKVINEVFTTRKNTTSIGQYEEQLKEINNDYIQSEIFAKTLAQIILADYAQPSQVREIEVTRGVPQLQTSDLVTFDDGNVSNTYSVMKKTTKVGKGGLTQNITLVRRTVQSYFTVGISSVGGPDVIAP